MMYMVTVGSYTNTVKKKEFLKNGKPVQVEYQFQGKNVIAETGKQASEEYLKIFRQSESDMKKWDGQMQKLKKQYGITKSFWGRVLENFKNYFSKKRTRAL